MFYSLEEHLINLKVNSSLSFSDWKRAMILSGTSTGDIIIRVSASRFSNLYFSVAPHL